MKKKLCIALIVTLLAVLFVGIGSFSVSAYDYLSGYYTYTISYYGGSYITTTITDVDSSISGDVTIPSTLGGYPVTEIRHGAFSDCDNLTSITIPDSVTSIGSSAFSYCNNLTSVTIGNNVKGIGNCAFEGCDDLTSITIPDSVKSIGDSAFSYCNNLTSVTIGNNVKEIGNCAFYGCDGLTSITIPDSVTSISSGTFSWCNNLTSVTIGNGVTAIWGSPFSDCGSLTSITVDSANTMYTSVDGVLFNKNETLLHTYPTGKTGAYTIPDSVTSIGGNAFEGCTGLTKITIPKNVTEIRDAAFRRCTGLTSITIPDSVTSIGKNAFSSCDNLTKITLPFVGASKTGTENTHFGYIFGASSYSYNDDYVPTSLKEVVVTNATSIGKYAFYGCNGLTKMTLPFVGASLDETEKTPFGYIFGASSYSYNDDYVPTSLKEVIITDATSIGKYAFYGCNGLTSITIPKTVTSIGSSAFSGCTGLTSITIPNAVKSIDWGAFSDCTGLKNVTIPDGVTTIGDHAFSGCTGLTSITIPKAVKSIGSSAFSGCTGLTRVEFNAVNCITMSSKLSNSFVFDDCTALETITIGTNVKSIPAYAFYGCSYLTNITIPKTVTSIGASAFSGCTGLKMVFITDLEAWCSIDFGGASANPLYCAEALYLNNRLVTDLVIPAGITKINEYAFYNCSEIVSVVFPNSVRKVAYGAFGDCYAIKNVYFVGTEEEWKQVAFDHENTYVQYATIQYVDPVKITKQPTAIKAVEDTTTKVKVTASGHKLQYQWQVRTSSTAAWKNATYTGCYTNTLTFSATGARNGHQYRCVVTDVAGNKKISSAVKLTIIPKITKQPATVEVKPGVTGKFAVKATGTELKYQWQVKTSSGAAWKNTTFSGYNKATLSVPATTTRNGYQFRCKVTNKYGNSVYSSTAKMAVIFGKISTCSVKLSTTAYTYNGKVKTPTVTVKTTSGTKLTKNTHYTVTYASGRKNAGTYKVTIKGKGNYSGTKTLTFKINPAKLSTYKLSTTTYTYDGKVKAPSVTVKNANGTKMTKNTHYTVTYASGRKNVGTYKVTIKGKGNYTGTKTLTFKIKPISITKCSVKLSTTAYTYNGATKTPSVVVKNASGTTLKKNTHYTVTYASGRKNIGTYKATVKMKGNYSGTKTLTFKINPAKTAITGMEVSSRSVKVMVKRLSSSQASGYQIQHSASSKFTNATTKTLSGYKTTTGTVTIPAAKRTYHVRVRTYKTVNGIDYYSAWETYYYTKTV